MYINLANIDFGGEGGGKAVLRETTIETLLTETTKVVTPPEGVGGFNKVTVTHAPVEESVSATITENGTHTITPSAGFDAMFSVSVNVNVNSLTDFDGIKYRESTIELFPDGLSFAPRTGNNCVKMFQSCTSLKTVKLFDTSKATDMNNMFSDCGQLTSVPLFDTSKVTNMNNMFSGCRRLTSVPLFDTSKVTNMGRMFLGCRRLTSVPLFDTSNVSNISDMLDGCDDLTTLGGFAGLKVDLALFRSPLLTHDSLLNVINEAADVTANPKTLTLGTNNLVKLTDEEKAIATSKGWTLA